MWFDAGVTETEAIGEVLKCEVCRNVVEDKDVGSGELICCDKPLVKQN